MNGQLDIGAITPGRYFYSIAIVLGFLFAMISTDQEKSLLVLIVQWQLQTVIPMALLISSHMVLLRSLRFSRLNRWLALAISGVIGASLFAPIALVIDLFLEPLPTDSNLLQALLEEWTGVVPPVAIAWIALNAPWQLGYRLHRPGISVQTDTSTTASFSEPDFFTLIPPDKRAPIRLLKSELHYLQVVTEKGSCLILYNLSDAVAQLPADAGLMVHRSYWVAFDAIQKLIRRGRQGELELKDGMLIPVSRNRLAEVNVLVADRLQLDLQG